MADAVSLCELAADIKAPAAGPCAYLQGKRDALEAREEKAAKAKQALDDAAKAREEQAAKAKEALDEAAAKQAGGRGRSQGQALRGGQQPVRGTASMSANGATARASTA